MEVQARLLYLSLIPSLGFPKKIKKFMGYNTRKEELHLLSFYNILRPNVFIKIKSPITFHSYTTHIYI
jgi:hypothetical protein